MAPLTLPSYGKTVAIVLGGDVNGLGQVRALGAAGVPVVVVCADKSDPAAHSRYASAAYVPSGEDYDARLLDTVHTVSRASPGRPVLFASSDAFVDFIARNRSTLAGSFTFNIADDITLQTVTDKEASHSLGERCGLNVPRMCSLQRVVEDPSLVERLSYPLLIKPRDSYSIRFPWKNYNVENRAGLERVIEQWPGLVPHALVQEIVPGAETCIVQCTVYIGLRSQAQACTVQKIHQQPIGFGTMSFGRTRSAPSVVDETLRLLSAVAYTGFASVEFKLSSAGGGYYLIEINPRLPWYNSLFTAAGVNFPLLAYQDLLSADVMSGKPIEQRDNIYWLHLRNELRGARRRMSCGSWLEAFRGLAGLWRSRAFGLFCVADLKPFIFGYAGYIFEFVRSRSGTTRDPD